MRLTEVKGIEKQFVIFLHNFWIFELFYRRKMFPESWGWPVGYILILWSWWAFLMIPEKTFFSFSGPCVFFWNFHSVKGYPLKVKADFGLKKSNLASWKLLFRQYDIFPEKNFEWNQLSKKAFFVCFQLGKSGFRDLCISLGVFLAIWKFNDSVFCIFKKLGFKKLKSTRGRRLTEQNRKPNRLVHEPKTENWKFISVRFTCTRY